MKIDIEKMSNARKTVLTIAGILYALSMLGQALYKDYHMMVAVTLAFLAAIFVLFLWVK